MAATCPHGYPHGINCAMCAPGGFTMTIPSSPAPPRPCDHCYCIQGSYSPKTPQKHVECCNCGNRQLARVGTV